MTEFQDNSVASGKHLPVLLNRCIELLEPSMSQPGAVYVDGTLGMGGHTQGILRAFPQATAIGIDRDPQALELASERLEQFGDRFIPVHATYDQIEEVISDLNISGVQGILMDLGVSSLQIDEADRGFSYAQDAPLDMRMDTTATLTAAEVLNTYSEQELTRILREYGEERFAAKIARSIVAKRETTPWERSAALVDLVRACIPAAKRQNGGNPAKRTFQALRIEVNGELEVLERALPAAVNSLAIGGRLLIESYHSLEDRLTKREFARGINSSAPPEWPIEPETHKPYLKALTRGAEKADETELEHNPRSAPVRLRAVERIRETPDHMKTNKEK